MSRGFAAFSGVAVAAFCGIFAAYTTWQPEFEKQRAERLGESLEQHPKNENVISQAIADDFKEAREQAREETKGFAWGIREAIWGKNSSSPQSESAKVMTSLTSTAAKAQDDPGKDESGPKNV